MYLIAKLRSALSIWPSSIQGDFKKIQAQIDDDNRKFGIFWSSTLIIFWAIGFIISFIAEIFAPSRTVYGAAFAVCAVTLLCQLFLVPRVPRLNRPMMYFVAITMFGASLWISLLQL